MSEADAKSRRMNLPAAIRAGWRTLADRLTTFAADGLLSRVEGDSPVVAVDAGDEVLVVRRFDNGSVTEIARMRRDDLTPASLHAAVASELARPWYARPAFALRLPETWALKRALSLPLAARRNLAGLLEFELDRQSPVDPGQVYHDHSILRSQDGTMEVAWRIFRRKDVDALIDICRQAGIELAAVALVSDEAPARGSTFPVSASAVRMLQARRWVKPALVLTIAALLMAVVATAYSRNQQANDALLAKMADARGDARVALQLEHQVEAIRTRAATLVAEKRQPSITRLLAEATRLLPDGTWLTNFSAADGEVRLRGYSNKASALIGVFDGSPLFANAEFRAPLVQAEDKNIEQFDLAVKIRGGAK